MKTLDQAWEALKGLDWGADVAPLAAIDQAIAQAHGNEAATVELEEKLLGMLSTASAAGRDFICRRLVSVGSARSVAALAGMLPAAETSHLARLALESMGSPEAIAALRTAAAAATGLQKIGLLGSLAKLKDAASVAMLAAATKDADAQVSHAAVWCLGQIGGADAVAALTSVAPSDDATKMAVADAMLLCADRFLAEGNNAGARDLYKKFTGEAQPKHVRLAANKGVLSTVRR
ncbi:MAG: HEAT repeat domain-containing protein [Pirellulaceae bacterium]|nr:HEAT repeat domain-containing protein [Pirellulaceae bacterium]